MPKHFPLPAKEFTFLKELVKNRVPFMIVGLTAAGLQGAPVVTQDIDLWFKNIGDPRIKKVLKKVGGSLLFPIGLNPPLLVGKGLEMFDIVTHMHGLGDFQKEVRNSIEVPLRGFKVKVLGLERIIRSKETLNREKDRLALPVLRDALLAIQKVRKRS